MFEGSASKGSDTFNRTTEEALRRVIRGAGFKPVQRDTLYTTLFLN
jgi:cyclic dehypoxanthinyl futalosine synthase